MQETFTRQQQHLFFSFIILLLTPALLINLGIMPFIDDEALRALIAIEMDISGNYITPTINGEYYYNKPPLYNWFLLLWFNALGNYEEFTSRLATVFCLLGYAGTIFYFSKKHYSTKFALLNAFFLITCGRILIYDSMLGLIDIAFSWVTFTAFMIVYHQYEKRNYYALFIFTYLLTAIGFLMKGLPSLVFQGATLFAFFLYKKDFKRLFSLAHITGGLLFLVIVGAYYFAYNQYNSLETVFNTLLFESSRRTASTHGMGSTILHLFTFPFEVIFHFLPWTVLVILFFQKSIKKILSADPFIIFCLVTFFANILVYWISVQVYPRYLFMHLPLLFTSLLFLYFREGQNTKSHQIIHIILGLLGGGLFIGVLSPLFLERTADISFLYLKVFGLSLTIGGLCWLFFKKKQERLLITVAILLVARLALNWFVIPDRYSLDWGREVKESSIKIGKDFKDQPLFLYPKTLMQSTNSYYLTRERMQIFRLKKTVDSPEELFVLDPYHNKKDFNYDKKGEIMVRYKYLTFDVANNLRKKD
ncbi:MAG: 4-amino-4-deoxy-L-arabinose transferase-like glycosyltransferase [Saprospiraceae bacterium]|jgi:4-amino-4-deoxy-L-arabinose transferase-like glycosyltransferase